jgi:hypothetical protein
MNNKELQNYANKDITVKPSMCVLHINIITLSIHFYHFVTICIFRIYDIYAKYSYQTSISCFTSPKYIYLNAKIETMIVDSVLIGGTNMGERTKSELCEPSDKNTVS